MPCESICNAVSVLSPFLALTIVPAPCPHHFLTPGFTSYLSSGPASAPPLHRCLLSRSLASFSYPLYPDTFLSSTSFISSCQIGITSGGGGHHRGKCRFIGSLAKTQCEPRLVGGPTFTASSAQGLVQCKGESAEDMKSFTRTPTSPASEPVSESALPPTPISVES